MDDLDNFLNKQMENEEFRDEYNAIIEKSEYDYYVDIPKGESRIFECDLIKKDNDKYETNLE